MAWCSVGGGYLDDTSEASRSKAGVLKKTAWSKNSDVDRGNVTHLERMGRGLWGGGWDYGGHQSKGNWESARRFGQVGVAKEEENLKSGEGTARLLVKAQQVKSGTHT